MRHLELAVFVAKNRDLFKKFVEENKESLVGDHERFLDILFIPDHGRVDPMPIQLLFLVEIKDNHSISEKVYLNYLSKALKRFSKLDREVDWFDGISYMPTFKIFQIPREDHHERQVIKAINLARTVRGFWALENKVDR